MGTHTDPVCGMKVDDQNAAGQSTYQEETYYFVPRPFGVKPQYPILPPRPRLRVSLFGEETEDAEALETDIADDMGLSLPSQRPITIIGRGVFPADDDELNQLSRRFREYFQDIGWTGLNAQEATNG